MKYKVGDIIFITNPDDSCYLVQAEVVEVNVNNTYVIVNWRDNGEDQTFASSHIESFTRKLTKLEKAMK